MPKMTCTRRLIVLYVKQIRSFDSEPSDGREEKYQRWLTKQRDDVHPASALGGPRHSPRKRLPGSERRSASVGNRATIRELCSSHRAHSQPRAEISKAKYVESINSG